MAQEDLGVHECIILKTVSGRQCVFGGQLVVQHVLEAAATHFNLLPSTVKIAHGGKVFRFKDYLNTAAPSGVETGNKCGRSSCFTPDHPSSSAEQEALVQSSCARTTVSQSWAMTGRNTGTIHSPSKSSASQCTTVLVFGQPRLATSLHSANEQAGACRENGRPRDIAFSTHTCKDAVSSIADLADSTAILPSAGCMPARFLAGDGAMNHDNELTGMSWLSLRPGGADHKAKSRIQHTRARSASHNKSDIPKACVNSVSSPLCSPHFPTGLNQLCTLVEKFEEEQKTNIMTSRHRRHGISESELRQTLYDKMCAHPTIERIIGKIENNQSALYEIMRHIQRTTPNLFRWICVNAEFFVNILNHKISAERSYEQYLVQAIARQLPLSLFRNSNHVAMYVYINSEGVNYRVQFVYGLSNSLYVTILSANSSGGTSSNNYNSTATTTTTTSTGTSTSDYNFSNSNKNRFSSSDKANSGKSIPHDTDADNISFDNEEVDLDSDVMDDEDDEDSHSSIFNDTLDHPHSPSRRINHHRLTLARDDGNGEENEVMKEDEKSVSFWANEFETLHKLQAALSRDVPGDLVFDDHALPETTANGGGSGSDVVARAVTAVLGKTDTSHEADDGDGVNATDEHNDDKSNSNNDDDDDDAAGEDDDIIHDMMDVNDEDDDTHTIDIHESGSACAHSSAMAAAASDNHNTKNRVRLAIQTHTGDVKENVNKINYKHGTTNADKQDTDRNNDTIHADNSSLSTMYDSNVHSCDIGIAERQSNKHMRYVQQRVHEGNGSKATRCEVRRMREKSVDNINSISDGCSATSPTTSIGAAGTRLVTPTTVNQSDTQSSHAWRESNDNKENDITCTETPLFKATLTSLVAEEDETHRHHGASAVATSSPVTAAAGSRPREVNTSNPRIILFCVHKGDEEDRLPRHVLRQAYTLSSQLQSWQLTMHNPESWRVVHRTVQRLGDTLMRELACAPVTPAYESVLHCALRVFAVAEQFYLTATENTATAAVNSDALTSTSRSPCAQTGSLLLSQSIFDEVAHDVYADEKHQEDDSNVKKYHHPEDSATHDVQMNLCSVRRHGTVASTDDTLDERASALELRTPPALACRAALSHRLASAILRNIATATRKEQVLQWTDGAIPDAAREDAAHEQTGAMWHVPNIVDPTRAAVITATTRLTGTSVQDATEGKAQPEPSTRTHYPFFTDWVKWARPCGSLHLLHALLQYVTTTSSTMLWYHKFRSGSSSSSMHHLDTSGTDRDVLVVAYVLRKPDESCSATVVARRITTHHPLCLCSRDTISAKSRDPPMLSSIHDSISTAYHPCPCRWAGQADLPPPHNLPVTSSKTDETVVEHGKAVDEDCLPGHALPTRAAMINCLSSLSQSCSSYPCDTTCEDRKCATKLSAPVLSMSEKWLAMMRSAYDGVVTPVETALPLPHISAQPLYLIDDLYANTEESDMRDCFDVALYESSNSAANIPALPHSSQLMSPVAWVNFFLGFIDPRGALCVDKWCLVGARHPWHVLLAEERCTNARSHAEAEMIVCDPMYLCPRHEGACLQSCAPRQMQHQQNGNRERNKRVKTTKIVSTSLSSSRSLLRSAGNNSSGSNSVNYAARHRDGLDGCDGAMSTGRRKRLDVQSGEQGRHECINDAIPASLRSRLVWNCCVLRGRCYGERGTPPRAALSSSSSPILPSQRRSPTIAAQLVTMLPNHEDTRNSAARCAENYNNRYSPVMISSSDQTSSDSNSNTENSHGDCAVNETSYRVTAEVQGSNSPDGQHLPRHELRACSISASHPSPPTQRHVALMHMSLLAPHAPHFTSSLGLHRSRYEIASAKTLPCQRHLCATGSIDKDESAPPVLDDAAWSSVGEEAHKAQSRGSSTDRMHVSHDSNNVPCRTWSSSLDAVEAVLADLSVVDATQSARLVPMPAVHVASIWRSAALSKDNGRAFYATLYQSLSTQPTMPVAAAVRIATLHSVRQHSQPWLAVEFGLMNYGGALPSLHRLFATNTTTSDITADVEMPTQSVPHVLPMQRHEDQQKSVQQRQLRCVQTLLPSLSSQPATATQSIQQHTCTPAAPITAPPAEKPKGGGSGECAATSTLFRSRRRSGDASDTRVAATVDERGEPPSFKPFRSDDAPTRARDATPSSSYSMSSSSVAREVVRDEASRAYAHNYAIADLYEMMLLHLSSHRSEGQGAILDELIQYIEGSQAELQARVQTRRQDGTVPTLHFLPPIAPTTSTPSPTTTTPASQQVPIPSPPPTTHTTPSTATPANATSQAGLPSSTSAVNVGSARTSITPTPPSVTPQPPSEKPTAQRRFQRRML